MPRKPPEDATEQDYTCGWCQEKFTRWVTQTGGGPHNNVSTQVKCPKCGMFIPTWPGGKVS